MAFLTNECCFGLLAETAKTETTQVEFA